MIHAISYIWNWVNYLDTKNQLIYAIFDADAGSSFTAYINHSDAKNQLLYTILDAVKIIDVISQCKCSSEYPDWIQQPDLKTSIDM